MTGPAPDPARRGGRWSGALRRHPRRRAWAYAVLAAGSAAEGVTTRPASLLWIVAAVGFATVGLFQLVQPTASVSRGRLRTGAPGHLRQHGVPVDDVVGVAAAGPAGATARLRDGTRLPLPGVDAAAARELAARLGVPLVEVATSPLPREQRRADKWRHRHR